jgi:large conductance mechanosensitive channel
MLKDFKQFILRGNVVDLAVAVAVGAAFTAIVTALVANIITPLIAAIGGQPDFSKLSITINHSQILYGAFLNAVISFLVIASAIFFLVVLPINRLKERAARKKTPEDPTEKKCPECLSTVPVKATRCAFCGIKLSAAKS